MTQLIKADSDILLWFEDDLSIQNTQLRQENETLRTEVQDVRQKGWLTQQENMKMKQEYNAMEVDYKFMTKCLKADLQAALQENEIQLDIKCDYCHREYDINLSQFGTSFHTPTVMKSVWLSVSSDLEKYYFNITSTTKPDTDHEDIIIPNDINALFFQKCHQSLETRVAYFPTLTTQAVMYFRFSTAKDMRDFMKMI